MEGNTLITAADTSEGGEGTGQAAEVVSTAPVVESQSGASTDSGASTEAATEGADTLAGDKGADSVSGAPESYADFVVPEGVALDTDVLGDFRTTAKELNLPQEAAQKVVDLGIKLAGKWADQYAAGVVAETNGWADAAKADPEIGGAKLTESVTTAMKAIKAFGNDGLIALIEAKGLGNHPEFIRTFAKIGKAISEDSIITGKQTATDAQTDTAKRLYPNMA